MGWFGDMLGDIGGGAVDVTVGATVGLYEFANTATFGFLGDMGDFVANDVPDALGWGAEMGGDVMGMNEAQYAQEEVNAEQQRARESYATAEVGRANQRTNTSLSQAAGRNKISGSSGTF